MKNTGTVRGKKQKRIEGILIILCIVIFTGLLMWFVGKPMLQFVSEPQQFQTWVTDKGFMGVLAYIGMVIFQVIVAVVPGGPFQIGAGYAFGTVKGIIICDLATTIGSVLVFLLVRKFGMRFIELFVDADKIKSMKFMQADETSKVNRLVFILFLIPGTPKDLISYAVGLTRMKLGTWIAITSVGRLPAIVLSVLSGDALGKSSYFMAGVVLVLILLGYFFGMLAYKKITAASEH